MPRGAWRPSALLIGLALVAGCGRQAPVERAAPSALAVKAARFAPTTITADISHLSPGDRRALDRLIEAGKVMHAIFLRQVWSGNPALEERLRRDGSADRLRYFLINAGPWSRLDRDEPFVEGVPRKPAGAGFYPEDMTKEEFERWVATLSPADQERARGFFTVVRRRADGTLALVGSAEEYRGELERAAALLHEAAASTDNATLARYLTARAQAFRDDDYYASDVAWMELDAPIDVTIGPYETYEDKLFGYKAAFEAFVTIRDDAETRALARYGSFLQELENHLPIDDRYKNPRLGALAPLRVVNEVFVAGDARRGVQTAAFNLPNDPRVIREKGSKRVMLRNMQEAKFRTTLEPIARALLDPAQLPDVAFHAFFTHTVAHELMHGLGPHSITVGGRRSSVRHELKELYSAIEEAKADVTGLWALQYLLDRGQLDKALEHSLYATFLASAFRSVRFGIDEAHGKAVALQFNVLVDAGGFVRGPGDRYRVDFDKIKPAVAALTRAILTIEAEGNYARAKELLDRQGILRPEMQRALGRLAGVPVDIEPIFPLVASR